MKEVMAEFASEIAGAPVNLKWTKPTEPSGSRRPNLIFIETPDLQAPYEDVCELLALNAMHEGQHLRFSFDADGRTREQTLLAASTSEAMTKAVLYAIFDPIEDERIMWLHENADHVFSSSCDRYRELAVLQANDAAVWGELSGRSFAKTVRQAVKIVAHRGTADAQPDSRIAPVLRKFREDIEAATRSVDQQAATNVTLEFAAELSRTVAEAAMTSASGS